MIATHGNEWRTGSKIGDKLLIRVRVGYFAEAIHGKLTVKELFHCSTVGEWPFSRAYDPTAFRKVGISNRAGFHLHIIRSKGSPIACLPYVSGPM